MCNEVSCIYYHKLKAAVSIVVVAVVVVVVVFFFQVLLFSKEWEFKVLDFKMDSFKKGLHLRRG